MKLNERISKARKEKGFTQEELADLTNVTVRTIQRIESGESVPRSFTLKAIAKALDRSYESLVADETTPASDLITQRPEDSIHFLKVLNLSCFSYLVLPIIHFLVPNLILNRQKHLDEKTIAFSRKIVRQQIYWVIALHLVMLSTLIYNYLQVTVFDNTGYLINYLYPLFVMCFINAVIILYNATLIRRHF